MLVHNAYELASVAKQRREALGWSQRDVALRVGVSRQWMIAFESGKSRLELGLVFRALTALGIVVDLGLMGAAGESSVRTAESGTRADPTLLYAPGPRGPSTLSPRPSRVPPIAAMSRDAAADPSRIVAAFTTRDSRD